MKAILQKTILILGLFLIIANKSSNAQTSLYGMRTRGGTDDLGTIFKIDNNGNNFQKTHDFTTGYLGEQPVGELTEYNAGEFYGTTTKGGTYDKGTIFKYDLNTGNYTVLHHFGANSNEGESPSTKLLKASNGKMYGLTTEGGTSNDGVLFEIDVAGNYAVKFSFSFANGAYYDTLNLGYSYSLVQAPDGNIYGTTITGGVNDGGVLYKFDGNGNNYVKLLDFNTSLAGGTGFNPMGSMELAPNGKLYGTTYRGGEASNAGTIFSYDYVAGTFAVVHYFQAITLDYKHPNGNLTYHNGKLWGTCPAGGTNNEGLLFSCDTLTGNIVDTYSFESNSGSNPTGLLAFGDAQLGLDTLFGLTHSGGDFGDGVSYYYVPATGAFAYFSFNDIGQTTGNKANSGLIQSALDHHFYGVMEKGGTLDVGTFIKCSTIGLEKVFDFNGPSGDGGKPQASLLYASNGKLYGTTEFGGAFDKGILFTTDLVTGAITKLVDFDGNNGAQPKGGLVEHPNGKIYGTTFNGGLLDKGCLFEFDTLTNTLNNVLNLSNTTGSNPTGAPIVGNMGTLFFSASLAGANYGTLIEYDPITNSVNTRHSFTATGNDGNFPYGAPFQAANGIIYGMTNTGGASNYGTIYSYNPLNNVYTKEQDFTGTSNGRLPGLSTLEEINGRLIGTTTIGGSNNGGAIVDYNYTTNTLVGHSFTNSLTQGYKPFGIRRSDNGKFYGSSELAGANNTGTIFEFDPTTNTLTGKYSFDSDLDGINFGDVLSLVGCDKPVITAQPQNIQTCPGSNVSFNFTANGSGLRYQWYKKQVLLVNDTNTTLNFASVAFADTGAYHCVIKNACGQILTQFVKLNVQNVPTATITPQGNPQDLCLNDSIVLQSISGTGLTFQWNFGGNPIAGANANSYVADSVNATGDYTVTVSTGPGCDNTSGPVNVSFLAWTYPTITATASTDTICLSANITFTTTASTAGFYQWHVNNSLLIGEINSSFTTNLLQNNDLVNVHFISSASCVEPSLSTIITPNIIIVDTCAVAPTLTTSNVTGAPFCAGASVLVPFTSSSNFNIGNIFTAQLSDANGNFTSPINIGQLTAISSGMIICTIPALPTSSTNYKIRVVANNPSVIGAASNSIEIRSNNFGLQFNASATNLTTTPTIATLNNTTPNIGNYTFNWYFGDGQQTSKDSSSIHYTYGYNGIYDVTLFATDDAGCTDTLFKDNYITVNAQGQITCSHTSLTNPSGIINACVGSLVPINSTTSVQPLTDAFYQWNRNGVPIGGASQSDYLISMSGNYTVTVFDDNACPVTSSPVQVVYSSAASPIPVITSTGTVSGCGNVNLTLTASGSFPQYLWSNGLTGNSINITQGGTYTVTGQSASCDAVSAPFLVDGTTAQVPEICMITVDITNELNKNYIIWEKTPSTLIQEYIIYREDTMASMSGVFHEIGRVSYANDSSAFLDSTSYAKRRSYRYKLGVMDTCGGYSIASSIQRSMHLKNEPGNNILQRYLYWNSYEGQPQSIAQYLIYRENLVSGIYELIDTVPATQTWYVDNNLTALNDTNRRYSVAYELATGCDVTRSPRKGCTSNTSGHERLIVQHQIEIQDAMNYQLYLFPNPSKDMLYIQVETSNIVSNNNIIEIKDITGRTLLKKEIDPNKLNAIDLGNLSSGCYFVSSTINNIVKSKKILIQK